MRIKKILPWIVLITVLTLSLFFLTRQLRGVFSPQRGDNAQGSPTPFMPVPPTSTVDPTAVPTATPSPTPSLPALWIDPALPDGFQSRISLPEEILPASSAQDASLVVSVGEGERVSEWIYALAGPFPTVQDGVTAASFHAAWAGELHPAFDKSPILLTASTLAVFSAQWGDPAAGAVRVVPEEQLSQLAWESRPSWALIPFESLNPSWKVIDVGKTSPIDNDFDASTYPLKVTFSLQGGEEPENLFPSTNREEDRLSTVVMTGVTALVRATAHTMENRGLKYPARDIRPWLVEADILHISNEVPFARNCPRPDPNQKTLEFCSDPRYIQLMEYIGTDIVELTGDHFGDWGPEAMRFTLDLYQERGWPYYGGGVNRSQGRQPVLLEHNGNRFGFIGCNAKGGGYAKAGADYPGAVACDFEYMERKVRELKGKGVIPIVTFQHFEYYTYQAQPPQIRDAARMVDAGAVIVSGSQAHQPQALELTDGSFVHHGLGNLFFDQLLISPETKKGLIDRHIFYDGEHISTELLSIIFVDFARARPMTAAERQALLENVFAASGW